MIIKDERPGRLPMIIDALVRDDGHPSLMSAEQVRDHYESLITNGKLMVVRTATDIGEYGGFKCSECGQEIDWGGPQVGGYMTPDTGIMFCPGCGAKIIE